MIQLGERAASRLLLAGFLLAVGWSLWRVELVPGLAGVQPERACGLLSSFWPPRVDAQFLHATAQGTLQTLAVAVLGTALAAGIGLPLAVLGSRAVLAGPDWAQGRAPVARVTGAAVRCGAALVRSVPEVVWGYVLVRVVGLDGTAAVVALGLAYGGMIARVGAEQIEQLPPAPVRALAILGAGWVARLAWAQAPLVAPGLAGYVLYRFECAVRATAIMGYLGGGGLGQQIELSWAYSRHDEVATQVLILVGLVALVEVLADRVRRFLQ